MADANKEDPFISKDLHFILPFFSLKVHFTWVKNVSRDSRLSVVIGIGHVKKILWKGDKRYGKQTFYHKR